MELTEWQKELLNHMGDRIKNFVDQATQYDDPEISDYLLDTARLCELEQDRLHQQFMKGAVDISDIRVSPITRGY